MYPSLENKIISGAFFKPPIDILPEKFFYATKDYCVEKEEIDETSCNLFISQFNKQQEYDLTIYMSKPEMNIEIDLEKRNAKVFGNMESWENTSSISYKIEDPNYKIYTEQASPEYFYLSSYGYDIDNPQEITVDIINNNNYIYTFPNDFAEELDKQYWKKGWTFYNQGGYFDYIWTVRDFISQNKYLSLDPNGNLKLTKNGLNLIKNNQEKIIDYFTITNNEWFNGYKIKVIIPNTKEFWSYYTFQIDIGTETSYEFQKQLPSMFPIYNYKEKIDEEGKIIGYEPDLCYSLKETLYVSGGLYKDKNLVYYLDKIQLMLQDIWKDNDTLIKYQGSIRLGNCSFFTEISDNTAIKIKASSLSEEKTYITNFSNGVYHLSNGMQIRTLEDQSRASLYYFDKTNNKIYQIGWEVIT